MSYVSPSVDRWAQQRAQEAAQAEARRQPRQDWTDLTFEEFQGLSGTERNLLFHADQAKYTEMSGRTS